MSLTRLDGSACSTRRSGSSASARARRSPRCRRRVPDAGPGLRRARLGDDRRHRRLRRRRRPRAAARHRPRPRRRAARRCSATARSSRASAACSRTTRATTWPSLLVGSEGTLGIITEVRLEDRAAAAQSASTALIPVDVGRRGDRPARDAARARPWRPATSSPRACVGEMQVEAPLYLARGVARRRTTRPSRSPSCSATARCWSATTAPRGGCARAIPERIQGLGVPLKLDVGVPLAAPRPSSSTASARSAATRSRSSSATSATATCTSTSSATRPDEEGRRRASCSRLGGTISAEHGVGVAKARWLELARGPAEVAAMRAVKDVLDPEGILNPGVVLP